MTVRVRSSDIVASLTFTTDTNAYASGDVIADTQEIPHVGLHPSTPVLLKSVTLVDAADQKVSLILVFLRSNTSLGTENAAPDITDTEALEVVGLLNIAAADYIDLGGVAVATKECSLPMLTATNHSLYVAILNSTGTPTYAAASLTGRFSFLR